ncbi:caspase family protein [Membranihabitans marinus]|uniref:caspase family protein n=1 Tax=Membranihabitans marinus TaxID=1227546 RepID=UPI001F4646C9|nr:caspase family protein [Membranihabitans marinus]
MLNVKSLLLLLFALPCTIWAQCLEGDCISGHGIQKNTDGSTYTGEFHGGKYHGTGVLVSISGNVYEGDWQNGLKSGKGKMNFHNGASYLGSFQNNRMEGEGKYFFANGDLFSGHFIKDSPNGPGSLIKKSGKVYSGKWRDGKLLPKTNEVSPATSEVLNTSVNIYLVIVGISRYENFKTLKYSDDDAYRVYAFFKSPEGGAVPEKNIRILIDESATKENIYHAMEEITTKADENDVVICYFAGHGLNGYFLPVDSDGYRHKISYYNLQNFLSQSKSQKRIFMADACFSGSLMASRDGNDVNIDKFYQALMKTQESTAFLLSSKEEEFSKESSGLRQGVFSYYLIQGLQGYADADHNDMVTIDELYNYIRNEVRTYTKNEQNPILLGQYSPNLPLSWIRKIE